MERKIEVRQLVNILTLFMIVQFGGLLIAIFSISQLQIYVASGVTQTNPLEIALIYVAYIILTAAVILVIFKFYSGRAVFILLEALVVMFATTFVFWLILSTFLPLINFYYLAAVSALLTLALLIAKNKKPRLRNLLAITSSIGVGIIIGFNGFTLSYLLMIFIAVYDYIAVFVTKHMITMAKEVSSRNLAFLIGSNDVEAVPERYLSKKDVREFKSSAKKTKIKDPLLKKLVHQGIIPMVSQVQLGSGDLAIPLMVAVSAYVTFLNYFAAVSVVVGAVFGMIFTMYLLKKYQVALPAIPPLFAFISLFLGIFFVITDFGQYLLWVSFFTMFVITYLVLVNKLDSLKQEALITSRPN